MKILYVIRSIAVWGGIERILVEKMNHLVTMYGCKVFLLTTDQGEHPVPYRLERGVHHEDLCIRFHQQYQYHVLLRQFLARKLKKQFEQRLSERLNVIRPDVIVCTTANPVDIGCIVRQKGNVPLVVESHSICRRTLGHGNSWFKRKWNRHQYLKSLKKADVLVALTEGDAADWRKVHPDVRVIPNLVSLNEGAYSEQKKRVIFVGRLDYQKRPMEAIRIWQMVWPQHQDWRLDIYGEGEQRQEIEQITNQLNMNIHIHQPIGNIFDCYRESSILVSTSLFEPFGLVISEAMSCGVPVVAYDCPFGPSTQINDGVNGFLVRNNDAQTFSERLVLLINDFELHRQMGSKAAEYSRRFSANQVMPIWLQLYEELNKKLFHEDCV